MNGLNLHMYINAYLMHFVQILYQEKGKRRGLLGKARLTSLFTELITWITFIKRFTKLKRMIKYTRNIVQILKRTSPTHQKSTRDFGLPRSQLNCAIRITSSA